MTLTALGGALAAGAAVSLLPSWGSLLIVLAAAVAAVLALTGRALRPRPASTRAYPLANNDRGGAAATAAPSSDVSGATATAAEEAAAPDFRLARAFCYLGFLTVGALTFRPAGGLNVSDWSFFIAVGLMGLHLLRLRRIPGFLQPLPLVLGIFLYALGGVLSSFAAVSPLASFAIVLRLLYLTLVWFWLCAVVLQTARHIYLAMMLWVVSASLNGYAAIAQFIWGDVIPGSTPNWGRMTGLAPHQNEMAAVVAIAFVPALALAVVARGWARLLAIVSVLAISAGELLSGSITALAAAAIATLLWLVWAKLPLRALLPFMLTGAAVLAIFLALTTVSDARTPFRRIDEATSSTNENGTLQSRLVTYRVAWETIGRNPFLGVGLDGASSQASTGFQPHNILLGPWYEAGILGLLGMATMLAVTLWSGWYAVVHAGAANERTLIVALYAAFIGFVLYAMTAPALYTRYGWLPAALLLAHHAQLHSRRQRASDARYDTSSDTPTGAAAGTRTARESGL